MPQPPLFFYFDMGNVLLSFDYDVGARNMANICGASAEACRDAAFGSEMLQDFETGRMTLDEFHRHFSQQTGTQSGKETLLQARCDMFSLIAPTARIVTQLKGVRQRVGLLSNTSADHIAWCRERFGVLRELIDEYVISCEVGAMKPDAKIYEIAIERAGVPADRIFFVDDRQENVEGAIAAGMDAVLFSAADQLLAELRSRGVEINL